MVKNQYGAALRGIRTLFDVGTTGGLTDEQLLELVAGRDRESTEAAELAFAELVARHGPMVLRVCHTILGDLHEAEDAFQATFLVLARRAQSIRNRGSAASWLHGVAHRVARAARMAAGQRRTHERKAAELARRSADHPGWDDVGEVLHEEIERLPERYRVAIVLCDMEGLTEGQAARQVGWPIGTVRSRLMRGRERLRVRLIGRGLAPSLVLFGSLPTSEAAFVVVPACLLSSTTKGALQFAAAGAVPVVVSTLSEGVLRAMFLTMLKMSAGALLAVGSVSLLVIGAAGFAQEKSTARSSEIVQVSQEGQVVGPAGRPIGVKSSETPAVSPRTKAILAKLEKPVSMVFPNETPLGDVLKYIKQATTTPSFPGLPIYVDPVGLRETDRTLTSTITIDIENAPLRVTLSHVLTQLGLAYTVKDEVLIISSRKGIDREQKETAVLAQDATPRTKAVLAKLDQPIGMSFPTETPLRGVLNSIKEATVTSTFAGVPVYVDPVGLKETDRSLDSTISIDLDGVPLRTTLRLLLKQVDLAYVVKDGLLIISSTDAVRKLEGQPDGEAKGKEK